MLANEGQRLREKSAKAETGEDFSDDEEEDDIDEELGYISPLDNADPYVSFKQALTSTFSRQILSGQPLTSIVVGFQMKNSQGYQLATTSLSPDLQTFLMEVMRLAEEHAAQPAAAS